MFASFFYLLRERGLSISLNEWLTLLEAMEKGLHNSSLTGFYHLCRSILLKSETEFDRFDQVFLEFFKNVEHTEEVPEEIMNWINNPIADLKRTVEELRSMELPNADFETILKMLEERIKEQKEEHNGGSYWIGTQGRSVFGNNGWRPNALRVGGVSQHRTAIAVAGERKFRDFRKDNKLDIRQFQMAFRILRQLSFQNDSNDLEFDVDSTIDETCNNAGTLKIKYKKPRKNSIKVLLLMDSGGSMDYYSGLCSMLFQAATKSNNFKELHTYYFHNCVYSNLYTGPEQFSDQAVTTEWVLNQYDSSYKVIIVGDAAMNPYEFEDRQYSWKTGQYGKSGREWLNTIKKHYPYLVWLNPESMPERPGYWSTTHIAISKIIKMFELSTDGIESAMKSLMAKRN